MTTKISFTIPDKLADQMNTQWPDIYLDVFGNVRLGPSHKEYTTAVGEWWRE